MGVLKCASLKIISLSNIVVVHLPNVMLTRYTAVTAKYHFRKMLIGQGMANILTQFQIRNHSNMIGNETDVKKRLKLLEQRFKDALELLEDVKSSVGTVYFSADMKEAEDFIEDTLANFRHLLSILNDDEKQTVGRTARLKMEELKAQLDILKDSVRSNS